MIQAIIERDGSDRSICAFHVEGHARFARSGKDIVCAGVSAVTVGTVNAVEVLLGCRMNSEIKKGWLHASLPDVVDMAVREKVQLLLESMVVMLESIQSAYGEYFQIQEKLK